LCVLFNGVLDHIVLASTRGAMIVAVPVYAAMAVIAASLANEPTVRRQHRSPRQRFTLAPPSVGAVRAAFVRGEEPVMVRWILGGILVNIGVLTSGLFLAVVLGNRAGIDFAAVDRVPGAAGAAAPLGLLAAAALAAFPFAGYLIARASGARSVLEPTIAALLAVVAVLVLLGLAAPIAAVFVIAFAPIALGLAGVGAWLGLRV
jgi:hypothetical protein